MANENSTNRVTRIDQPHSIEQMRQAEPSEQPVAVPAEAVVFTVIESDDAAEQVRGQADQLSTKLQTQQNEIERRATLVSSQEADVDSKIRTVRIWVEERADELDQREAKLNELAESLTERETLVESRAVEQLSLQETIINEADNIEMASVTAVDELSEREVELDQQQATLTEAQSGLEARHLELDERQAALYQEVEQLAANRAEVAEEIASLESLKQVLAAQETATNDRTKEQESVNHDLCDRAGELEMVRAELRTTREDQEQQDMELTAREQQLAFRQQEIEAALVRFKRLGVTETRMEELQEQTQMFFSRTRYLDDAERMLEEEKTELADLHREVERREQLFQQEMLEQRRLMQSNEQQQKVELRQREQQVTHREAELDQREEAFVQLQGELQATQREVLDMRLATEETWAQLAGALAPASLARSISQVRAKLADHYRLTVDEISQKQEQLEELRSALTNEHSRVENHRSDLKHWAEGRQEDIDQQAGRLMAREQELDRQQAAYEQLEAQWALDRDEFKSEIRHLLGTLRETTVRAAA